MQNRYTVSKMLLFPTFSK